MNRLFTLVVSTVVVGLAGGAPPSGAQPAGGPGADPVRHLAAALSGNIEGVVVDERGQPLPGAMVSALGATSALAVTDRQGTFVMRSLPAGAYMVRAHLTGFAPSRRQFVDVRPTSATRLTAMLQRAGRAAVPVPAAVPTSLPPRVAAAGVGGTGLDALLPDPFLLVDDPGGQTEDRSEKAWRLRHLPRSVLKDTTERTGDRAAADGPDDLGRPGTGTAFGRAMGSSARFLSDLPVTGQVNLFTSGSLDGPSSLWSSDGVVRGTANLALAGPALGYGDWSARIVTQSDVGSWFLTAAFRNRAPSRNRYDIGFSYSTQRFATATARWPLPLNDISGRAAGSIYGVGRLLLTPRFSLDYGTRYSRYDYLGGPGLVSPSVMLTVVPIDRVRVRTGLSRRMLAPGAEEFLEPLRAGMWVPPEHTFVGVSPMVAERTMQYEASVEGDVARGLAVAFRTFYQGTTDQQIALFGGRLPEGQATHHYAVGNAGDVSARGWSVGVTHTLLSRLRGSVAYQVTQATWLPGATPDQGVLLLGLRPRPLGERLHDVTTSVETDIPYTATHVFLAYKLNTGFARPESDPARSGLDSRFDVQVTQRLPFLDFTSAQWQVLVAVKNVFRDGARDSSVYDELLVVKPPTRVVGGVVVRF